MLCHKGGPLDQVFILPGLLVSCPPIISPLNLYKIAPIFSTDNKNAKTSPAAIFQTQRIKSTRNTQDKPQEKPESGNSAKTVKSSNMTGQ